MLKIIVLLISLYYVTCHFQIIRTKLVVFGYVLSQNSDIDPYDVIVEIETLFYESDVLASIPLITMILLY